MHDETVIQELLRNHLPDECEFAGNANVNDVVRFVLSGIPPEQIVKDVSGGQDLSLLEVMTVLVGISVIAKNSLDVYLALKRSDDSPQELDRKATETTDRIKKIVDAMRRHAEGK